MNSPNKALPGQPDDFSEPSSHSKRDSSTLQKRISPGSKILVLFAAALCVLIALGFRSGWLALHSDERPIGRLRPSDLIETSVAQPPTDADNPPSTIRPGASIAGKPNTRTLTPTTAKTPPSPHDSDNDSDD